MADPPGVEDVVAVYGNHPPLADERAKWAFHVEMLTKEIEMLRAENERLRALSIKSLDQSIALLDRIAHIDGTECGSQ